eukprot:2720367-Prymnesium_polylepis.1
MARQVPRPPRHPPRARHHRPPPLPPPRRRRLLRLSSRRPHRCGALSERSRQGGDAPCAALPPPRGRLLLVERVERLPGARGRSDTHSGGAAALAFTPLVHTARSHRSFTPLVRTR